MKILYYGKKIIPKQIRPLAKNIESAIYFVSAIGLDVKKWKKYLHLKGSKKYIYMQKVIYEHQANKSKYNDTRSRADEAVVGSYDEQNKWPDYDKYLMKYVDESFKKKVALDFACGPGRCIIKYHDRFKRIDGTDISENNIKNAKKLLVKAGISIPNLYVSSGNDLGPVRDNYYDFIYSEIAMQHICVHEVRLDILKSMYKALKVGGRISIQMGYGKDPYYKLGSVGYFDNKYGALSTNSQHDCRVENPKQVKSDLTSIGFKNYEYWIRPTGPGCNHEKWIYFTAVK